MNFKILRRGVPKALQVAFFFSMAAHAADATQNTPLDQSAITALDTVAESLQKIDIPHLMGGKKAFGKCATGAWVYEPFGLGAFNQPTKSMKKLMQLVAKKCPKPKKGRASYPDPQRLKSFFVSV